MVNETNLITLSCPTWGRTEKINPPKKMIPDHLLRLACAEFPTRQAAMNQAPYGNDRIIYTQPIKDDIALIHHLDNVPYERLFQIEKRELILRRLPSGFWAFLPTHSDDLVIIAEHKKNFFMLRKFTAMLLYKSLHDERKAEVRRV